MEGAYTEVIVKTTDRPGLLTEIVHSMKDININVISAEVSHHSLLQLQSVFEHVNLKLGFHTALT